ncbi:MAG: hypothetical protein KDI06_06740, partial [Calditrichaeota bacterium]|nr:hypothetical protein [Calditrichota bacterium]
MPGPISVRCAFAVMAGLVLCGAGLPAAAQSGGWRSEVAGGAAQAVVCAEEAGAGTCFRIGCADGAALHFSLDLAGGVPAQRLAATLSVDGSPAGSLVFAATETGGPLIAPFDP